MMRISKILKLPMNIMIPATSASVERANSALKFGKNIYRSKMSEDRLNSLILMYVPKDIKLDYNYLFNYLFILSSKLANLKHLHIQ